MQRPTTVGRPYPPESSSNDLWFQHVAIVVQDIDAAYAHLQRHAGWTAISADGPQTLPPANGSVRAFKFRDPDGHPVELIWFPPGQGRAVWHHPSPTLFRGIDHSAIAVSDSVRSVAFYEGLGLTIADRSRNHGPHQARLDGLPDADVHIVALRPPVDGTGIELLAYDPPGQPADTKANDIAADAITLAVGRPDMVRDPDGHRLILA